MAKVADLAGVAQSVILVSGKTLATHFSTERYLHLPITTDTIHVGPVVM